MSCSKLKESSDFERILVKSLCYALGQNRGVIIKEDDYVLLVYMDSDGKLKIEDVSKTMGSLNEGDIVELHETIEDAITKATLYGGRVLD